MEVIMPYKTGNFAHDTAIANAEIARQNSAPVGSSQSTYKAADLQFARAALASCISNNSGSGAAQYTVMLKSLGVQT
jgi:hypothetical protein